MNVQEENSDIYLNRMNRSRLNFPIFRSTLLSFIFILSGSGLYETKTGYVYNPWTPELANLVSNAKLFSIASIAFLIPAVLGANNRIFSRTLKNTFFQLYLLNWSLLFFFKQNDLAMHVASIAVAFVIVTYISSIPKPHVITIWKLIASIMILITILMWLLFPKEILNNNRLQLFYFNPNLLASFLFLMIFALTQYHRNEVGHRLALIGCLTLIIIFTGSRTFAAAAIFILFSEILLVRFREYLILFIMICILATIALFPEQIDSFIFSYFIERGDTRSEIWSFALDGIEENINVQNIGLDNLILIENYFLTILANFGILGFISIVMTIKFIYGIGESNYLNRGSKILAVRNSLLFFLILVFENLLLGAFSPFILGCFLLGRSADR